MMNSSVTATATLDQDILMGAHGASFQPDGIES